ncbi:hypothetical protein THASP1DRAFT_32878, partial [Thamnocephalis sphaerospora]
MKSMLKGKKKKEPSASATPTVLLDGQPVGDADAGQAVAAKRRAGNALITNRNSMFGMQPLNMLLGKNKLLSAITNVSSSVTNGESSRRRPSAAAATATAAAAAASPVTLVRRASSRLLNSRFSSYETLRPSSRADSTNPRFSRSTENLTRGVDLTQDPALCGGPLMPSSSDPGAYRQAASHEDASEDHDDVHWKQHGRQQHEELDSDDNFGGADRRPTQRADEASLSGHRRTHSVTRSKSAHRVRRSGFLAKKTDFRGGWKVYEAALRGGKLYFYKPVPQAAQHQVLNANGRGMALQAADFDPAASAFLFEPSPAAPLVTHYQFGIKATELDAATTRFRRYVSLLLFKDRIVVCRRKWVRSSRTQQVLVPLMDSSRENAQGYYTKWKLDDVYSVQHVELMEAASSGFDAQSPLTAAHPEGVTGDDATEATGNAATLSDNCSVASGTAPAAAQLGFQIFVSNHDASNSAATPIIRLFVARTDEARSAFMRKLQEAQSAWEKTQALQSEKKETSAKRRASTDQARGRRFWGTTRHPELIVEEIGGEESQETADAAKTTDAPSGTADDLQTAAAADSVTKYRVLGGSVDALLHELIYQTSRSDSQEVDSAEFLATFLTS